MRGRGVASRGVMRGRGRPVKYGKPGVKPMKATVYVALAWRVMKSWRVRW